MTIKIEAAQRLLSGSKEVADLKTRIVKIKGGFKGIEKYIKNYLEDVDEVSKTLRKGEELSSDGLDIVDGEFDHYEKLIEEVSSLMN